MEDKFIMDKEKHRSEAKKYNHKDCCYIHSALKDGDCETIVSGGQFAIMHAITEIIEGLARTTGRSYNQTLMDLERYKKIKDIIKNRK